MNVLGIYSIVICLLNQLLAIKITQSKLRSSLQFIIISKTVKFSKTQDKVENTLQVKLNTQHLFSS